MSNELKEYLKRFLPEELVLDLDNKYDQIYNISLFDLGIDSLLYMQIIADLFEKSGEIGNISTLQNIEEILNNE